MFRIHFQHTHKIYIQFNMYYFELLLLLLLQFQLYKLLWLTVNILSLYSRLVFYFILDWCAVPKKKKRWRFIFAILPSFIVGLIQHISPGFVAFAILDPLCHCTVFVVFHADSYFVIAWYCMSGKRRFCEMYRWIIFCLGWKKIIYHHSRIQFICHCWVYNSLFTVRLTAK